MTGFDPERLRGVRTLDDVLELLCDELDWPTGDFDLEDATFEFSPEELGLPADQVPTLTSVRQLRPLTAAQPWGIFFLEFTGPKLPVTPLRRLLRALVHRKRAASGGHRTWDLDDLLFIAATDSGDSVELHLLAFFDTGGPQPEIRSLPWSPSHSPRQHLKRLAWELLPRLGWPADQSRTDAWREQWREAFALRHGEALGSASALAERMAGTAHGLRERVAEALKAERGNGPFSTLLAEIRDELVGDIDAVRFADMCAQTLVYGALTARVVDPEGFGASPVLTTVPLSNPFLTSFFEQVHDQVTALDLEAAGLESLVADLRETNVEAILDQFGATSAGGDPVIHFYERFLQSYDSRIRALVGAFYTPQAVVACIVRLVDEALRTRFGLPAGVADRGTWAEVTRRTGLRVPDDVDPQSPFVAVLDPATGTGTFLVEWIRQARRSFLESGSETDWPDFLKGDLIPGMRAFEILLAPYAIAHLKVSLEAGSAAAGDLGPNILLTDTLELPGPVAQLEGFDPVAREGERAAEVKRNGRPTVLVANPPYRRVRREEIPGWVANADGNRPALVQDFVDLANSTTIFSHVASLYNLYVYFWRWAIWKAFEQPGDAPGIVAFITASSWLDGPGFVGLREAARSLCSEIWIVDLGGDNRGTDQEENVFAIETPVAIAILIRAEPTDSSAPARVSYRRIRGGRAEKLAALGALRAPGTAGDPAWEEVASETGLAMRPPAGEGTWLAMPALADLFPWQQPGAMLNRTWPVAPDPGTLAARWAEFLADRGHERRSALFPDPRSGRKITTSVGNLPKLADLDPGAAAPPVAPYQWRAFDRQWTFRDPRLAKTESPALWQSLSSRQVFFATLASEPIGPGPALLAFTAVPDKHVFRGSFGGKDIIPLYRDAAAASPNVMSGLTDLLRARLGRESLTEEHLAAYVFALLSTPGYQLCFEAELRDKVVRVPLTADAEAWDEAVALGRELIGLHTFGERSLAGDSGEATPDVGVAWKAVPSRIPASRDEIAYDVDSLHLRVADGCLAGVRPDVWDYEVSGWPVVPRWLEQRTAKGRGKRLSELDRIRPAEWAPSWTDELLDLVVALTRTIELRPRQDELLERISSGPLIAADELPDVDPAQRAVPPTEPPRA